MKTLKLVSAIFIFSLFQNCGTDQIDIIKRTYKIENGTNREVKIDFYEYGRFQQTLQIVGEGLIFEGSNDNDAGKGIAASGTLGADSIITIFDNKKRIVYTNISLEDRVNINPKNRNILLNEAYEILSDKLYRFTFTEEDYENAEDCDGICG